MTQNKIKFTEIFFIVMNNVLISIFVIYEIFMVFLNSNNQY